jgi:hypothetical protein
MRDPSMFAAEFLKKSAVNLDGLLWNLKKRGSWNRIGLVGYMLPVDWNKAKVFPSGSLRTA